MYNLNRANSWLPMAEGKRSHLNGHDSGTESPEMALRPSQSNGFTRTSNSNKMNNFKIDTKTKSNTRGVISGLTGSAAKSSGRLKCKVILLDGEEFECEIDVSNPFIQTYLFLDMSMLNF